MSDFSPGDRVWFHANPKDATRTWPGIVRKICPKRITIEAAWHPHDDRLDFWVIQRTSVKPENLSPRETLCEQLGENDAADV